MATLYKHGEIGQIERLSYKLAYCEDGKILRNNGDGWKLWRKVKEGVNPAEHFNEAKAKYAQKLTEYPSFAEWRRTLHELVAFRHRHLVLTAIQMLGNDVDGLWSELEMFGSEIELSLEDCKTLVDAYEASQLEAKLRKEAQPA